MNMEKYTFFNEEWNQNRAGEIQQGGTFSTGSTSYDSKGSWR